MKFKRFVAALTVAGAVGIASAPAFAATAKPAQGTLAVASGSSAPVLYKTGDDGTYLTTVQLAKNPGDKTTAGSATIHYEKWRDSDHTRVAYWDFSMTLPSGKLQAGMTGTKFTFSGSGFSCSSYVGSYTITSASNSGSTITALAINFSESCAGAAGASVLGSLSYHV